MAIVVSGILIEVVKKNVKNMRLYVKPPDGKVMITAPETLAYGEIEKFARSKEAWIKEQLKRIEAQSLKSKNDYADGGDFYLWGKKYALKIERGGKKSIKIINKDAVCAVPKNFPSAKLEKFINDRLKKQFIEEVKRLLPKWEKKTNLKCESWNARYMTSRWGSCKPKKRKITFNIHLVKKPVECLEYIILHELIHFEERGHNERFYALVSKYMPNWKEIRAVLKGRN